MPQDNQVDHVLVSEATRRDARGPQDRTEKRDAIERKIVELQARRSQLKQERKNIENTFVRLRGANSRPIIEERKKLYEAEAKNVAEAAALKQEINQLTLELSALGEINHLPILSQFGKIWQRLEAMDAKIDRILKAVERR